jgi:hypothetical protein
MLDVLYLNHDVFEWIFRPPDATRGGRRRVGP